MRRQCNQIRDTTHKKGKNGKYNRIECKRTRANYEKRLPALNSALKILQELATLDLVFFWSSSSVIGISSWKLVSIFLFFPLPLFHLFLQLLTIFFSTPRFSLNFSPSPSPVTFLFLFPYHSHFHITVFTFSSPSSLNPVSSFITANSFS